MKKILLFCGLILSATVSQAGLMIEPYIGQGKGTFQFDAITGTDVDATMQPTVMGARIGFKYLGLWVAGDYTKLSGNFKFLQPVGVSDESYNSDVLSLDVGYNLPIMFRVWAGMTVSNKLTWKNYAGDVVLSGGSNLKLGVGYNFAMFFSLNVEYFKPTYKTFEQSGTSSDATSVFNTFSNEMLFVTLSFPFSL